MTEGQAVAFACFMPGVAAAMCQNVTPNDLLHAVESMQRAISAFCESPEGRTAQESMEKVEALELLSITMPPAEGKH